MRTIVLPYLTPSADVWDLGAWHRLIETTPVLLGDRLEHWDYSVPLNLTCEISVDVGRVRQEAALNEDDGLTLACFWEASSTGIRQVGFSVDLPQGGVVESAPVLHLDGGLLGGRLKLTRQVVLTRVRSPRDPLSAARSGSVILSEPPEDARVVILEGTAARFPTEPADFSALPIAEPDALWYLDIATGDLDTAALAAIRLYLNTAHPAVVRALDPEDPIGSIIRSTMQWDVARTVIRSALRNAEFIEGWGSFEEESLGEVIQNLIERYWPGETSESLRQRERDHPGRFEYQLQARLRLMVEVE
jgi:hypothetical protein